MRRAFPLLILVFGCLNAQSENALPPGIRIGEYEKAISPNTPRKPAEQKAPDTAAAPASPTLSEVRTPAAPTLAAYPALRKNIENVFPKGALSKIDAGIFAVSLDRGDVLLDMGADKQLIPASVSKLFTAYTALKRLKPTATFETSVWATGPIMDGKLGGDLYLRGGGDPSLVSERLWMLVNELVRSGIKQITGDLIADSSYYDMERTPDTRPSYLTDQAYNAPVGALSFNFNTTTIYVKPAETSGKPPTVYTDPENSYIDVVNQATTGKGGSSNTIAVKRTEFVKGDIGDTVLLRGSIPTDHGEMRFYRNIVNPSLYAAHMFKTFWEQRGMRLGGNIKEGTVSSKARQILKFESLPLWQIVWGMNKFSNNFVADQILKKVGAEVFGAPGSLEKGLQAMKGSLEQLGIPAGKYTIIDGSGLTRKTKVTARQVTRVLEASAKDLSLSAEFIASLGIGGEDGTLRNRLPSEQMSSIVRGKTGSLDGVNALAGYTTTKDGEQIAFAILLNDPGLRYGRMSGWIDRIALELSKFSRK
ncbi:D-alanyl-D-alanine carboxypeptidase/D-alanyl-D-alanine-endopeptidase [bacterium]|nr:D-alanyl-D-alanine carboxypeptidase/D-alanyl-D-alanine-endopeptidase [bacterium]